VPSIVVYRFLGLRPPAASLRMEPRLPKAAPEMGIANLLYRGTRLDVKASAAHVEIAVKEAPAEPWRRQGTTATAAEFSLVEAGVYRFERVPGK
jgi:hypothetical protein